MDERFSKEQLIGFAKLTDEDFHQSNQCRRAYNRLGEGLRLVLYAC